MNYMKKLLFVEDDEFLGTVYSDLLKNNKDIEVHFVKNGNTAYDEMLNKNWDLIILDALLPDMHATEILKMIKTQKPEKLKTNIIILTNLEEGSMLEELKSYNFDIFYKSKLNPDEFLLKINSILSNK